MSDQHNTRPRGKEDGGTLESDVKGKSDRRKNTRNMPQEMGKRPHDQQKKRGNVFTRAGPTREVKTWPNHRTQKKKLRSKG